MSGFHVQSLRTHQPVESPARKPCGSCLMGGCGQAIVRDWPVSSRVKRARFLRTGSAVGEEVLQQPAALGLEDAAPYLHTMVEPRVAYDVKKRADRAGLRIEGAEDQPSDSGQHQCA